MKKGTKNSKGRMFFALFAMLAALVVPACKPLGEESQPAPEPQPAPHEDAKLSKLEIASNKTSNVFDIKDSNGVLNLVLSGYDEDGAEMILEGTVWSDNLPEGVNRTSTDSSYIVSLDDINSLSDYTVKAANSGKETAYTFTLDTTSELDNNLYYSIVPLSGLQRNELGQYVATSQFSPSGVKISDDSGKVLLADNLSYTPSGNSFLYITAKNNSFFGNLDVYYGDDVKQASGIEDIRIVCDEYNIPKYTGEISVIQDGSGGVYLFAGKLSEDDCDKDVLIQVKAGTKKERDLTVTFKKGEENSGITKPLISSATNAVTSGLLVDVTGDSISNSYYKPENLEGLYELRIKIERTDAKGNKREYNADYNPETKEIRLGKRIHLADYGKYVITASVRDVIKSESSGDTVSETIEITPRPVSDFESWISCEKNAELTAIPDFTKNTNFYPADNYTTRLSTGNHANYLNVEAVKISVQKGIVQKLCDWNSLETGRLHIVHSPYSENAGKYGNIANAGNLETYNQTITIDKDTEFPSDRNYYNSGISNTEGERILRAYPENSGSGYGNIPKGEEVWDELKDSYVYTRKWNLYNDLSMDEDCISVSKGGGWTVSFDREKIFNSDFLKANGKFRLVAYRNTSYSSLTSSPYETAEYTYTSLPASKNYAFNNGSSGYYYTFVCYRYANPAGDMDTNDFEFSYPAAVKNTAVYYKPANSVYPSASYRNSSNKDIVSKAYRIQSTKDTNGKYRKVEYIFSSSSTQPSGGWTTATNSDSGSGLSDVIYSPAICSEESCYNSWNTTTSFAGYSNVSFSNGFATFYLHMRIIPTDFDKSTGWTDPLYADFEVVGQNSSTSVSSYGFSIDDSDDIQNYFNARQVKGSATSYNGGIHYYVSSSSNPSWNTFSSNCRSLTSSGYLYYENTSNQYFTSSAYVRYAVPQKKTDAARGWYCSYSGSYAPKFLTDYPCGSSYSDVMRTQYHVIMTGAYSSFYPSSVAAFPAYFYMCSDTENTSSEPQEYYLSSNKKTDLSGDADMASAGYRMSRWYVMGFAGKPGYADSKIQTCYEDNGFRYSYNSVSGHQEGTYSTYRNRLINNFKWKEVR